VRVAKPQARLERLETSITGEVRARRSATLAARVGGTVQRLRAEVGDRVKEGQPLVELDPETARLNVDSARAAQAAARSDLSLAAVELKRNRMLLEADASSQAALDRVVANHAAAQAALQRADANLALAEKQLRDTVARAPFDGVVTARLRQVGESVTVTPATELLTIVDTDHLEVRLAVPEAVAAGLAPGLAVQGTVSPSGKPFRARVRTVGATVEAASRTVEVLLDVQPGGDRTVLRPGALVETRFGTSTSLQGPFLPAQAVHGGGGVRFVWAVDGGRARKVAVRTEGFDAATLRVLSGLAGDEQVVVTGAESLRDGDRVRAVE